MFEPQSVESHQLKHQPEVVGLTGKSTGNNEITSALWKGVAREASPSSVGKVATLFGAGSVLGAGTHLLLPEVKTPQALAITGIALTGVAGYALLRHGAEWFHDAKVVVAPQNYSKNEHELAENSLRHAGSCAADIAIVGLGITTGRALSEKFSGSSPMVAEAARLPKVNLIEEVGVPDQVFALPTPQMVRTAAHAVLPAAKEGLVAAKTELPAKAELRLSLAAADVPESIEEKEIASPAVSVKFVEPPPAPVGSKEHAARTLISQATDMSFVSKMERGTNGAYLIKDKDGVDHIFKLVSPNDVTPQIYSSAKASAAVDSLAARTPRYEEVKYTPGHGTWYMQELLPGNPAPVPSDR